MTQGGTLRKSLNEMEREAPFRSKFKYVETTGKSLIDAWILGPQSVAEKTVSAADQTLGNA